MSLMYQDPLIDYYGLNSEDDPADTPVYDLNLFDSYEEDADDDDRN